MRAGRTCRVLALACALFAAGGQAADPADRTGAGDLLLIAEDRHLTLVDGDRLRIVRRAATRALLPGSLKRSPGGRHAYVASPDGWISKVDAATLAAVAEVRAGTGLQDIALSADGAWLLAGTASPHGVAIFDADLRPVRSFPATSRDGAATSRIAAVADAASRRSFIVVLQDVPEIWEISYDPRAEDIYDGLVHDYRMSEGVPMRGFLHRKRSVLGAPLAAEARELAFDPEFTNVLGAARAPAGAGAIVQVVNLDVRRRVAATPLADMPRPGAAVAFAAGGRRVLAMPSKAAAIEVIDLESWQPVKTIATPAPVQFLTRHPGGRFTLAVAAGAGPVVLDHATLETSAAGDAGLRSCGPAVFSRSGRHAWLQPCAGDADLLVIDAATLKQVRRITLDDAPRAGLDLVQGHAPADGRP